MTTTIADPWIERHIDAGRLVPGARGLSRAQVAAQHNSANALDPSDTDYLFTPDQAQMLANELLALIGITIAPTTRIMLTDGHAGPWCGAYCVNVSQLEFALEQDHQITGERINADALLSEVPWA